MIVGARFVPGGRLVSTLAAGRCGMSLAHVLPWSARTSAVWALHMLASGLLLAPLIGGDPLRGLVAGLAVALLVGGLVQLVRWLAGRPRCGVRLRSTKSCVDEMILSMNDLWREP